MLFWIAILLLQIFQIKTTKVVPISESHIFSVLCLSSIFFFDSTVCCTNQIDSSLSSLFLNGLTLIGFALSLPTLINLGTSFGLFPAHRKLVTNGIYSVVRHPLYAAELIWMLPAYLNCPSPKNLALFIMIIYCLVRRANYEEEILIQADPSYLDYKEKVKYRVIPGLL